MSTQQQNLPSGAEGIKEIVALAHQARGVTLETIIAPDGQKGVPPAITVGIRHGTTPEVVDLSPMFEKYREHPAFKRGTARALTLQSFIDLVNRHRTPESAVFADTSWEKPFFEAVIDYHEPALFDPNDGTFESSGQPDNLRHRVRYDFPLSVEWQAWTAVNGQRFSQADFAAFIEDHIAELASPMEAERIELERDFQTTVATPSQLMTLAREMQVRVDSKVKQAVTLQSGEGQVTWEETHNDATGKPLKVPGVFILNVSPFFMGEKVRIPVRLRYRVSGSLTWTFHMYRPDIHVTDRVREDLGIVGTKTLLPTFQGTPEA